MRRFIGRDARKRSGRTVAHSRKPDRSSSGRFRSGCPRAGFAASLRTVIAPLAVVSMVGSAGAEDPGALAACAPQSADGGTATVRDVIDAVTLRLTDGRLIRLRGLAPPENTEKSAALARQARAHLATLLADRRVRPLAASRDPDRYGRIAAHLQRVDDGVWIDAAMVRAGFAFLDVEPGPISPCRAALSRFESAARSARRHLWAEGLLAVRKASDPALGDAAPGYAIIEGKVLSVGKTRNRLFLNFGRKWREDFTITIYRRDLKRFVATGLDPEDMRGKRIRARGWLERRDGALINAKWPSQIERLD